jgi:ornithine carbamoyltransferase
VRHVLTLSDLGAASLRGVLRQAATLKRRRARRRHDLAGRTVALVFQQPSMRTRVAFEVAVLELGGAVIYLGQDDIQLNQREPANDIARVLSRYVDAIVVRTFAHPTVEEFAAYATCPVINGLSDLAHPCQALADLLTMQESLGRLRGIRVAYVGDGNNVLHSLAEGCAMLGAHLTAATPPRYRPDRKVWQRALQLARAHRAQLRWTADPRQAVRGAEVVYTDVWVSMGQEAQRRARLAAFRRYQLNRALLRQAAPGCRIMHCLPAHRGEEITDDLMADPRSLIFEQAENRLHVQKALLLRLIGAATHGGG